MFLADHYFLPPGCCALCHAPQRTMQDGSLERIVDTERRIEGEVRIFQQYICESCVISMADLLGFAHPQAVAKVVARELEALRRCDVLEEELAALSEFRAAYERMAKATAARMPVPVPRVKGVAVKVDDAPVEVDA